MYTRRACRYLISGKLFSKVKNKFDSEWVTYEFILAILSFIVVLLLKISYFDSFPIIGSTKLFVNMDHSGNRVAAMLYVPENVVIIVGINKVIDTLDEAIFRVRNIASPKKVCQFN